MRHTFRLFYLLNLVNMLNEMLRSVWVTGCLTNCPTILSHRVLGFFRCPVFIARCYTERGYATEGLCRPSVCLRCSGTVITLGWSTSKIISRLISIRFMLGLITT